MRLAFCHMRARKRSSQWFKLLSFADDFPAGYTQRDEYCCNPCKIAALAVFVASTLRTCRRVINQHNRAFQCSNLAQSGRWRNLIFGFVRGSWWLRREVAALSATCHVENHTGSVYIPGWWFILYMTSSPVTIIHTFYYSSGMFILRGCKVNVLSVHLQIWCSRAFSRRHSSWAKFSCLSPRALSVSVTLAWPFLAFLSPVLLLKVKCRTKEGLEIYYWHLVSVCVWFFSPYKQLLCRIPTHTGLVFTSPVLKILHTALITAKPQPKSALSQLPFLTRPILPAWWVYCCTFAPKSQIPTVSRSLSAFKHLHITCHVCQVRDIPRLKSLSALLFSEHTDGDGSFS